MPQLKFFMHVNLFSILLLKNKLYTATNSYYNKHKKCYAARFGQRDSADNILTDHSLPCPQLGRYLNQASFL